MACTSACITAAGQRATAQEKPNEDRAHTWTQDGVTYFAIADGNGGTEEMQPAAFVINEIQRFITIFSAPNLSVAEIKRMIVGAIHCANRVLLAFKRANGELYTNNCFTTICLCAVTEDNKLIYASSGDSRIYLVRGGHMAQITKDQTEAQKLCDEGKIAKEEIFSHPDRDVLTSALGFADPKIDLLTAQMQKEDILLMLTDGVYKVVNNQEIGQIIQQAGNCDDTCDGLIKMAEHYGGPDNESAVVVYFYE